MLQFSTHFPNDKDKQDYQEFLEENRNQIETILKEQSNYEDSLGWFTVDKWAGTKIVKELEELAAEIRKDADVFVVIGVGGSNNAARSVIKALQTDGPEIIYSGNTLSAFQLKQILNRLEGKSVYLNCIAKNFETLEPGSSFRVLRQYLIERYGEREAARRIIGTGTVGSHFESFCQHYSYRFLEFPLDVGGRYTAVTTVGLFPMAVAGIAIASLVDGASNMQEMLHQDMSISNPAYAYAAYRNVCYRRGYRVELLASFEPQLGRLHKWWLQLFGESEGKENRGLLPTCAEYSEDLHAIGQFIQEGSPIVIETFIDVQQANASLIVLPDSKDDGFDYLDGQDFWQINKIAFEATYQAHSKRLPCSVVKIDSLDAYHFGQLFYFFEFACYLSCQIMGVNPFNQPGVEDYKQLMFDELKRKKDLILR